MSITATCYNCGNELCLEYCATCQRRLQNNEHCNNEQLELHKLVNEFMTPHQGGVDEYIAIYETVEKLLEYYYGSVTTCSYNELLMMLPTELVYDGPNYRERNNPDSPIKVAPEFIEYTYCYEDTVIINGTCVYRKRLL